jgi:hypothetical protein
LNIKETNCLQHWQCICTNPKQKEVIKAIL